MDLDIEWQERRLEEVIKGTYGLYTLYGIGANGERYTASAFGFETDDYMDMTISDIEEDED